MVLQHIYESSSMAWKSKSIPKRLMLTSLSEYWHCSSCLLRLLQWVQSGKWSLVQYYIPSLHPPSLAVGTTHLHWYVLWLLAILWVKILANQIIDKISYQCITNTETCAYQKSMIKPLFKPGSYTLACCLSSRDYLLSIKVCMCMSASGLYIQVVMEVDTGAAVSVIIWETYEQVALLYNPQTKWSLNHFSR